MVDEQQLTTLMVTHSMQQALDLGDRTLMLHEGKIVLDISGDERKGLTVNDLLQAFAQKRVVNPEISGDASTLFSEDALLLG